MRGVTGIFLVDKSAGPTSAQVISRLKRGLQLDKLGHAGTLDPFATGLLVCLAGRATRIASYAEAGQKVYSGVIQLGLRTKTDDVSGEVIEQCQARVNFPEVQHVCRRFVGQIEQIPPQVSALKIGGKRAYERARRGEVVPLGARTVHVYQFEVWEQEMQRVGFRIRCEKGTYIRAIARDVGELLGCGACLLRLRREFSAPFSAEEAKDVDAITSSDMIPWERLFQGAPRIRFDAREVQSLAVGQQEWLARVPAGLTAVQAEVETGSTPGIALYEDSAGQALGLLERRADSRWQLALHIGNLN